MPLDVAVVGSGLGGLSAAALLARSGLRVAVFEAHDEPGGYATRFLRDGFSFEVSLHELDAVGPGEPNRPLLDALGLTEQLELLTAPYLRREVWPGHGEDLWLPKEVPDLVALLDATYPGCGPGVDGLFALAREVHERCYEAIDDGQLRLDRTSRTLHALLARTAGSVLREHIEDPGARRILGTLASYLGLFPRDLSALSYLLLLWGYHGCSGRYPRGGSHALTAGLVRVVEAHGGTVHLSSPVRAIRCRRGRAQGLTLGDGTEIDARWVVSNASPLVTFGELVPLELLHDRYRTRLAAMRPSTSLYCAYLGLDAAPDTLAPMAYETYLHHPDLPVPIALTATSLVDPSVRPCLTLSTDRAIAEAVGSTDKDAVTEAMLDAVERHVLPGLRDHVVVRQVAHPGTFERYTGNPGGAVFGFAATPEQSGPRRLLGTTPIRNLLLASAWVFPGAGQTAAMQSGRLAASQILRRVR